MSNYIKTRALRVDQPFGEFFVVQLSAEELLSLTFSDSYREDESKLTGSQRAISIQRKKLLGAYIKSRDCAFPNSIILAANYTEEGLLNIEKEKRWKVEVTNEGSSEPEYSLVIPECVKLSAIIDGQHRIAGFEESSEEFKGMNLVCSVYLDLPPSLQAFLFATINLNQQPVTKNHAYGLFAYELSEGQVESWSPDKVAISIANEMHKRGAFFKGRLKNAAINSIKSIRKGPEWNVSVAAVVDSVLRLISKKPKFDRLALREASKGSILRSNLQDDGAPLRELYLNNFDEVVFDIVENCFSSIIKVNPSVTEGGQCLTKTVGIQGVFEFLSFYITNSIEKKGSLKDVDLSEDQFVSLLTNMDKVDFTLPMFMASSAVGKRKVKDTLLYISGLKSLQELSGDQELCEYLSEVGQA